jgi:hypothetical protein
MLFSILAGVALHNCIQDDKEAEREEKIARQKEYEFSQQFNNYKKYNSKLYNKVYSYQDNEGYYHLIRDGVDLLENLQAINCFHYCNYRGYFYNYDDYEYQTKDEYWHLVKCGKDVLYNKNAIHCHSYNNQYFTFTTEDGYVSLVNNNNDKIVLDGTDLKIVSCTVYNDEDFLYKTEDGYYHLIHQGIDLFKNKKIVYAICSFKVCGSTYYQYRKKRGRVRSLTTRTRYTQKELRNGIIASVVFCVSPFAFIGLFSLALEYNLI